MYTDAAPGGEDYNPFCYELQRRLVKASRDGNLDEMRNALKEGAHPDGSAYSPDYDSTPLFAAAEEGRSASVRLLLDNGAEVNQGDFIRGTPLLAATDKGHLEVVKILLERGANICMKFDGPTTGSQDVTAGDLAQLRGFNEIAELLKAEEAVKCK